ncbi:MAG: glycosyl hydrolase, partial [Gemmatimonadetes bacterium]|nr:glycosyl hydrolase [Gemmatimonadota bacterium]
HGAQRLLRTTDLGKTWTAVSPDLTRNERAKQGTPGGPYTNEAVGAENYGTLAYVAESPHERGVIWTGSDDGLVHVTRDGGRTWTNVTPKGLAECLVNAIELSPFDKGTAYIATTRYKFNDHAPGLYKTTDYGATWTRIDRGIPPGAFTRVVREDDGRRDLLFAGTEQGLYLSWNGGRDWMPFQRNLPRAPITDLKVHQGNLIAATSGRGLWVLDDLAVLRQHRDDLPALHAYRPSPAMLVNGGSELDDPDDDFTGAHPLRGVNPATGVVLYYRLPAVQKTDTLVLEIADATGRPIRTFRSTKDTTVGTWDGGPPAERVLPAAAGLNRFVWDLRHATMAGVPGVYIEGSYRGHKVPPGRYRLTLRLGAATVSTEAEVRANPQYATDAATYAEYDRFMAQVEGELTRMHEAVNAAHAARGELAALLAGLPADARHAEVRREGEALLAKLTAWDGDMVSRKTRAYDDTENFPQKFTANWLFLVNATESDLPRVNQPSRERLAELEPEWAQLKARVDALLDAEVPALNRRLYELGIGAIRTRKPSTPPNIG